MERQEKRHCEKCSYETDDGLAITGCDYCGCHTPSTNYKKGGCCSCWNTALPIKLKTGGVCECACHNKERAPERWEEEFDSLEIFQGNMIHGRTGFREEAWVIGEVKAFIAKEKEKSREETARAFGGCTSCNLCPKHKAMIG